MIKIGIISAMIIEVGCIKEKIRGLKEHNFKGINFITGLIDNVEVVVCVCSIGKVNAAIYTQIMIDKFDIDYIINTGIAGSMSNDVKHLDIVISEYLTYYDVRKEQLKSCYPYQEYFIADKTLLDMARELTINDKTFHFGTIITGDDFIAEKTKKDNLLEKYDALCVEMEGAAIAHTAFINQIPFIVIRSISDTADDTATCDYKNFEQLAAQNASKFVIKICEKM